MLFTPVQLPHASTNRPSFGGIVFVVMLGHLLHALWALRKSWLAEAYSRLVRGALQPRPRAAPIMVRRGDGRPRVVSSVTIMIQSR